MSLNTASSSGKREKTGKEKGAEKSATEPRTTMKQFAGFLLSGTSDDNLDDVDSDSSIRKIKEKKGIGI
jgi:hypothetical protein